jgi:hypothetical protein
MADRIRVQILPDGRVRITTDEISATNHRSADALLKGIQSELGGETTSERRRGARLTEAEHQRAHRLGLDHAH